MITSFTRVRAKQSLHRYFQTFTKEIISAPEFVPPAGTGSQKNGENLLFQSVLPLTGNRPEKRYASVRRVQTIILLRYRQEQISRHEWLMTELRLGQQLQLHEQID